MEDKLKIPNFKRLRMACERESYDKTYEEISKYLPDVEKIKRLELELEYELSFPINKYLNKIKPGDILVSDMYLSEEQIRNIICKHKIIDNPLYVHVNHKNSGSFWRRSEIVSKISKHYGDNYHSDILSANRYGVKTEFIDNVELNTPEEIIESFSPTLSYLIRACRLTTQNDDIFNNCAYTVMLPLVIVLSMYIHDYCKNNDIHEIIFLSRDGYWFNLIFPILFPEMNSRYEYFSRLMSTNKDEARKFISMLNTDNKKLVVDLNGSGTTFNHNIMPFIKKTELLIIFGHTNHVNLYPNTHSLYIDSCGKHEILKFISIEDFLGAPHGSIDHIGGKMDPEYDITLFKEYMIVVDVFKKYFNVFKKNNIDIEIPSFTPDIYILLVDQLLSNIKYIKNINEFNKKIKHLHSHEHDYTRFPIKYYSQIGQDQYFIENIIKYKCNGVFLDIGGYDGITGSNTYALEKYFNWKGIIVECLPEFAEKCRKCREAIVCGKAIYKNTGDLIDITIPDGDEIFGGKEQLSCIKEFMRPNYIEVFKKSFRKKRTIQVETININDLLDLNNIHEIDYLSIDIEGYELEALKTLDFTKNIIKYITIEFGFDENYKKEIYDFLTSKNYNFIRTNSFDDEYMLIGAKF
jgi:FkbM family methyltransferase